MDVPVKVAMPVTSPGFVNEPLVEVEGPVPMELNGQCREKGIITVAEPGSNDACGTNISEETKRNAPQVTTGDIFKALRDDKSVRKRRSQFIGMDNVDTAEICSSSKKIKLLTSKTIIKQRYGFHEAGITYLFPEEALYLLETHKLEIIVKNVPLSVQRARALLLDAGVDKSITDFDGTKCGVDEYTVFKVLAKEGYRLRRPMRLRHRIVESDVSFAGTKQEQEDASSNQSDVLIEGLSEKISENSNEDVMETDSLLESSRDPRSSPLSKSGGMKRDYGHLNDNTLTKRRKLGVPEVPSNVDDDTPEVICDYNSIPNPINMPEEDREIDVIVDDDDDDDDDVVLDPEGGSNDEDVIELGDSSFSSEEDEPQPSTSRGPVWEPYTVSEVDSDVEFIDEVIITHPGVDIEEVEDEFPNQNENIIESEGSTDELDDSDLSGIDEDSKPVPPQSSNGRSDFHDVVDLVSSDEEGDKVTEFSKVIEDFAGSVWSKLVPRTKATFTMPPKDLLPENIRSANISSVYHPEPSNEDSLEDIVDCLNITEEVEMDTEEKVIPKTWKEWKSDAEQLAKEVFDTSLFGKKRKLEACQWKGKSSDFAHRALNLWEKPSASHESSAYTNTKNESLIDELENLHRFDLYPPTDKKLSKTLPGIEAKSMFRVLITKSTSRVVHSLANLQNRSGKPTLVAVIDVDGAVTFVSLGTQELDNLFSPSVV